jgi:hypothetical protein
VRPARPSHATGVLAAAAILLGAPASRADDADAAPPSAPPSREAPFRGALPVDTRSYVATTTGYGGSGLGLGIGGRLGTTFSNGVTIAASATYQGWETGRLASNHSAFYGGAEAGYDVNLRYVVLRPYFAVGVAVTSTVGATDAELAVWGGLQTTYDLPRIPLFLALDLRLVSTAAAEDLTPAVFAGCGVRFGS